MSKYQICVSGSAAGQAVEDSHALAYQLGKTIAERGHTLITGATIGLPRYAAKGAIENGGLSVGFSPAATLREHVNSYRLPTREFSYINFTGMEYVGRDVHLVRSCDAIITVGGRMGSLHEFSTAIESRKICAVLLGSGGLADFLPLMLKHVATPHGDQVIYDTDPARLVDWVIAALDKKYADFKQQVVEEKEPPAKTRRLG
ncbi:MAG: hypothetical protein EOT04_02390 [Candidatus Chaera renei]|uniref:Uncharacterized protein n=1 Tax=Candidatus Chaera renei TaxID=2506947 RepID=A0A4Q0AK01_9BACT|nr:MAG: hypothetical protein EOT04_02390 [Candidatus Chaera renei]